MIDPQDYITFADETVGRIVAENWGDGTGIDIEHLKSIRSIGTVFRGTDITQFPELAMTDVLNIPDHAFDGCKILMSIDTSKIGTIGSYAFNGCISLGNLKLDKLMTLGQYAFKGCKSISESIPSDALSVIGTNAYQGCLNLELSVIPANVTHVGQSPWANCDKLKYFVCLAKEPPEKEGWTFSNTALTKFYVPDDLVDTYRDSAVWGNVWKTYGRAASTLPEEVKAILGIDY